MIVLLQSVPITTPKHPALPFVRQLYETSFPPEERRAWPQLLAMLSHPGMQLSVVQDATAPIGFIIQWPLPQGLYIEHLAIDPALRGQQAGSRLLQQLIDNTHGNILLETELPHDEPSTRRIRFYQRAGFHVLPFPYQQPPYRAGEPPLAMQLMSLQPVNSATTFEEIAIAVKTTVYEAWY